VSDERDDAPQLSEREFAELAAALSSAYAPKELDESVNERLLREALEDPLGPASAEEVRESERLRRALDGEVDHPDLDLVHSLVEAHRAARSEPAADLVERATERALGAARAKQHGSIVYLTFAGVLAAAAAVALFVQAPPERTAAKVAEPAPASVPPARSLQLSRTSEELFEHKFSRGHTSDRIDRIATARARDLRNNRFRQWGVE